MVNAQIKSRKRVSDFGEVFTDGKEAEAMLDLVSEKSYQIETTFLEPSCGNGNFLIAILKRKLNTIINKYSDDKFLFEVQSLVAVSSIYGIDIQKDNIEESRKRLLCTLINIVNNVFKEQPSQGFLKGIKFVLKRNLICGDFLTYKLDNGNPLILTEWDLTESYYFRRKDFLLEQILSRETKNVQTKYTYYNWMICSNLQ